jgi:hypothetical protein
VRGALRASPPRVRSLAAFGRRPPVDAARLSLAGIRNPAHGTWNGISYLLASAPSYLPPRIIYAELIASAVLEQPLR